MQSLITLCKRTLTHDFLKETIPRFKRRNTLEVIRHSNFHPVFEHFKSITVHDFPGEEVVINKEIHVPASIENLLKYANTIYASRNATCLNLYEAPTFHISLFYLPRGFVIPYHDHDGMVVMTKILRGAVDISSMTYGTPEVLATIKEFPSWMTRGSPKSKTLAEFDDTIHLKHSVHIPDAVTVLGPVEGNIHQVRARENTLMLDILTPPYDPYRGRDCNYYKIHEKNSHGLYHISKETPEDFHCELVEYKDLFI